MKIFVNSLSDFFRNKPHKAFFIIVIFVSLLYGIQARISYQPKAVHHWRQGDCASIALNYYQNDMNFFKPQVHLLCADGATTSYVSTSEAPILYYFAAILYKLFGAHETVYRLLVFSIFLFGLFHIFKTIHYITKSFFWGIFSALLLFSSPTIVYYSFSFLSDMPAFSFAAVGLYYFTVFIYEQKPKFLKKAILIFGLAMLFKITAGLLFVAIGAIFLIELLGFKYFNNEKKLFEKPLQYLPHFLIVTTVLVSWTLYAMYYNQLHAVSYFSTRLYAIWQDYHLTFQQTINQIIDERLKDYFFIPTLFIIIGLAGVCLFFFKKNKAILNLLLLFSILGVITNFTLWFWVIREHDYYTITLFVVPVVILAVLFAMIKEHKIKWLSNKWIISVALVFLLINITYTRFDLRSRYLTWRNYMTDSYLVKPYLQTIGVFDNDTVISVPDNNQITLYLMNVKGWTEFSGAINDSATIASCIERGAKFLIVNKKEYLEKPQLQPFLKNKIGSFNEISIFLLKKNITINDTVVYNCNAEVVNSDNNEFICENVAFKKAKMQTQEEVFEGKYAIKMNNENRFGFPIDIFDVQKDEKFFVEVWAKGDIENLHLTCGGVDSKNFYESQNNVIATNENGWTKIGATFNIYKVLQEDKLGIYIYYTGEKTVFADNFKIVRVQSE